MIRSIFLIFLVELEHEKKVDQQTLRLIRYLKKLINN